MARRSSIMVSRTLYQIGVVTLVAALVWVGIGIYTASTKVVLENVDNVVLTPINPTIDEEIIEAISQRIKIDPDTIIVDPVASESAINEITIDETILEEDATIVEEELVP